MKIVEWISDGHEQLSERINTIGDLYDFGDTRLIDIDCENIIGPLLFRAEDGKYYTGTIKFVVSEATEEDIADKA